MNNNSHRFNSVWIWSDKASNQNISIKFEAGLKDEYGGSHFWTSNRSLIFIRNNGWNLYKIEEKISEV
jgi:hypothetical protein